MTLATPQTPALAGPFISETAVRGALARRRRRSPVEAVAPARARRPGDRQPRSPRRLRRWSVAELIAAAGARPTAARPPRG